MVLEECKTLWWILLFFLIIWIILIIVFAVLFSLNRKAKPPTAIPGPIKSGPYQDALNVIFWTWIGVTVFTILLIYLYWSCNRKNQLPSPNIYPSDPATYISQ